MGNPFYSAGVLADIRSLNDATLTDTCSLIQWNTQDSSSVLPTLVQDNSGGVKQTFADGTTGSLGQPLTGIPCRVDVLTMRGVVPERTKDNVETEKITRFVYISLAWCLRNSVMPKIQDQLSTAAGDPLGRVTQYRILEVNYETDDVDIELLVEVVT